MEFYTDADDLARAVREFEATLPGWWWSVGQCNVGAHASCGVDRQGPLAALLDDAEKGRKLSAGFDCDTTLGQPADALRDVMRQAAEYMRRPRRPTTPTDQANRLRTLLHQAQDERDAALAEVDRLKALDGGA